MILSLAPSLASGPDAESVLMLGNSYTANQDLPGALTQVFEAAGQTAQIDSLTSGGLTLADHAERASDPSSAWYDALVEQAGDWNWVILQDQSQIPGFPVTSSYYVDSLNGAEFLNGLIESGNAQTVFFMTWGYREGDAMNAARYPDYSTMQARLTEGYLGYVSASSTDDRPTWVAPVGLAYSNIYAGIVADGGDPADEDSLFRLLYASDGSHPSPLGTYLAACVFYATLSGKTPVGLKAPKGMDENWADALQQAAAATVFDETDEIDYPWESKEESKVPEDSGDTGQPSDSGESRGDGSSDIAQPSDAGEMLPPMDTEDGCACSASSRGFPVQFWAFWMAGIAWVAERRQDR